MKIKENENIVQLTISVVTNMQGYNTIEGYKPVILIFRNSIIINKGNAC